MRLNRRSVQALRILIHYKSFTAGLAILLFILAISLYAIIEYPYNYIVRLWNDVRAWEEYPKLAKPSWTRFFTGLSELEGTIVLDSRKQTDSKVRTLVTYAGEVRGVYIVIDMPFRYDYDVFPSQIIKWLYITSRSPVFISIMWVKPEGTVINISRTALNQGEYYVDLSLEALGFVSEFHSHISSKLGSEPSYTLNGIIVLMGKEDVSILKRETAKPSKGVYRVIVRAEARDANADVDIKINIYGTLYGLAGTDNYRRDLFIAIAWGAPLALSFGLAASVLVTLTQMFIAALSAWYGGVVDNIVQRVNEVFMILPFLPVVIMISLFYRFNIWSLLAVVVALGIWGGGLKTLRAMFLQIREMPYIEAAQSYGASSLRIIVLYMIPRALPIIIPNIIISTPDYVFLEAVLALMGISDPSAITWGRVLEEAYSGGALYRGYYHWILAPASMLVLISIAFALIGFTLDRVLNPRLKSL